MLERMEKYYSRVSAIQRFKLSLLLGKEKDLYNYLIVFGIHMIPVSLIKMCLPETSSKFWVGKNLSDIYPFRNTLKNENYYHHSLSTKL